MENNKQKRNSIVIKKRILQAFIVIFSLTVFILSLITMVSTIKVSNLAFGRTQFYIMKSNSYPEIAEVGDLVIAKRMEPGEIKTGDKIVYKDNEYYYCETVKTIKKNDIVNKIVVAEKNGINYQFNENEIKGKVVNKIHRLGAIISFIRTPFGIVMYILFLICLFALLRILVTYSKEKKTNEEDTNVQE